MKTAREMFADLGFEQEVFDDEEIVKYTRRNTVICKPKTFTFENKIHGVLMSTSEGGEYLYPELINAIVKQCKELGWNVK